VFGAGLTPIISIFVLPPSGTITPGYCFISSLGREYHLAGRQASSQQEMSIHKPSQEIESLNGILIQA
jgi:hypothetical protein